MRIFILIFFLFIAHIYPASLIEAYRNGTVRLKASPEFGKGVEWERLFYDAKKDMVMGPEGRIFVANNLQHNIFKFDKNGVFTGQFGREGQGPGDLYYPGRLSILDNQYLVVEEYATSRRISLFDLSGKPFKVLKTNHNVYQSVALKENRVAYLTYRYGPEQKIQQIVKHIVIIKDVLSGRETVVDAIPILDKGTIRIGKHAVIMVENHAGSVLIGQTKEGNLLVGASNTPEIRIYAVDGKLVRSFHLKMKPLQVTADYVQKFKADLISHMKGEDGSRSSPQQTINQVESLTFKNYFLDHLPYYREILVDSAGNILVFKWTDCFGDCPETFQVYSPEGQYICTTRIDRGIFDFSIDGQYKNIIFSERGIFGLFQLKDSEDISLRLVKVKLE